MNATDSRSPSARDLVHPLDTFYDRNGTPLPPLEEVDGNSLPEPYRMLLVHERDMTSTLEDFHQGPVSLQVVGRERAGDLYYREVVLVVEETGLPVEFGAIKIHLDRFSASARRKILEEHWPLGHILKEDGLECTSRPKGYLKLASDHLIAGLLRLSGAVVLYGRRNTLSNLAGGPLAEIVEILPPTGKMGPSAPRPPGLRRVGEADS